MRKKALICGKLAVEVTKVYRSCSVLGFYIFFFFHIFLHCTVSYQGVTFSVCGNLTFCHCGMVCTD